MTVFAIFIVFVAITATTAYFDGMKGSYKIYESKSLMAAVTSRSVFVCPINTQIIVRPKQTMAHDAFSKLRKPLKITAPGDGLHILFYHLKHHPSSVTHWKCCSDTSTMVVNFRYVTIFTGNIAICVP
jgi:hypothetical protein